MKSRIARVLAGVVLGCAAAPLAYGGLSIFNFNLDGSQEVPPTGSDAVGSAQLIYDDASKTFDLDLVVFGIALGDLMDVGPNDTPVHLHMAPPGENGPIVIDVGFFAEFFADGQGIRLQIQDAPFGGQQGNLFSDPQENEAALFAGNLYLNIHTISFPGGEIRGQVIPGPAVLASLMGAGVFLRRRSRR